MNSTLISLAQVTLNDMPGIITLSDTLFGEGYISDITGYLDNRTGVAIIAKENNLTVGFVLAQRCAKNDLSSIFETDQDIPDEIKIASRNETLGTIKTIGVHPPHQSKGIGRLLFSEAQSRLTQKGIKLIVVPGWVDNGKTNIAGLMNHYDYSIFMTKPDLWKSSCENNEFHCPSKNGNSCVCGASFFKKTFI